MANAALFIGWGEPVRGRERKSLQVLNEALAYFRGQQEQGRIESFEPVLLEPHGGDLTGFLFVRGDQQTLLSLTGGEEFQRLEARSRLIVDNWGVVPAVIGEALPAQLAVYQQQIEELT
jgi:hypothetical protein